MLRPTYKKVFDTVKSASRVATAIVTENHQFPRLGSMTTSTLSSSSSGPRMSSILQAKSKNYNSSFPNLDSAGQSDSEGSLATDSEEYPYVSQTHSELLLQCSFYTFFFSFFFTLKLHYFNSLIMYKYYFILFHLVIQTENFPFIICLIKFFRYF